MLSPNANVWVPAAPLRRLRSARNQFGGSVGGPIKGDRTFFLEPIRACASNQHAAQQGRRAYRPRSQVVAQWFNTAAFIANPIGTDGNAARNLLDGPGLRKVDLALFRAFRIRERMRLQARAEMTNAFNLVSLTIPSAALATTANVNAGVLTSPLFGQIRNAAEMRQTQVGLRLNVLVVAPSA